MSLVARKPRNTRTRDGAVKRNEDRPPFGVVLVVFEPPEAVQLAFFRRPG